MSRIVYAAAPVGDLAIIEFKPTSSESVVIENISASSVNLQNYILEYFNKSVPTSFNVPTATQNLPNFNLAPNQTYLFTGDSIGTCGAVGVSNLALSLSDSSGYLEIVKSTGSGGNITYTQQDKVSWTSTSSGADIVSVPSATSDANAVWYRKLSDGTWNKFEIDSSPCSLYVTVAQSTSATYIDWATGAVAPSEIIVASSSSASIPSADVGLSVPQITELLPNPTSPQSDSEDEFIELYNPNDKDFDLSGFKLQVGLTTTHTYTFPSGTILAAGSFKSYYSIDTNLSMSNTSGQAKLIDPLGSVISQSDPYSSVKEGQSWDLANGSWYWATPTPDKSNTVSISSNSTTNSSTSSKLPASDVKSASTNVTQAVVTNSQAPPAVKQPVKIHTWTIAAIGAGALLYALYEYRADIQNRYYQFRRYRETRAPTGRFNYAAFINRIKGRLGRWQNNPGKRNSKRSKKRKRS